MLLILLWFSTWRGGAVGPDGKPISSYDAVTALISILGIMVAVLAIGLAVAAFFGFQAIREILLARCDIVVNDRLNNHPLFRQWGSQGLQPRQDLAAPEAGAEVNPEANNI